VSLLAVICYAANVHFKGGNPTFSQQGFTLCSSGALAGLGNQDITVQLIASGTGSTVCTNKGGNNPPGQQVPVSTVGTQSIAASEIKNGTVSFHVCTQPPSQPTAKEAGCPNNNFTATITSVSFSSATITVVQGGQTVLQQTFSL
jgi:hypothetical protein